MVGSPTGEQVLTGRVGSGEEVSDKEISEVLSAQDSLIVGSPDTYRTKPRKHADLGIHHPERIILAAYMASATRNLKHSLMPKSVPMGGPTSRVTAGNCSGVRPTGRTDAVSVLMVVYRIHL
jgi:hypothetical protein